ncbi:MAG: S41 family peptidase [Flavobacteriales bacterium]|nr:S41 family peptidase [Flavobacteriales bacterium]
MRKSVKKILFGIALIGIVLTSIRATSSYFEISKNLDIFASLFRELDIYYVDETSPGDLMKTGIDAMLGSLDPYTNYIAESDIEDYRFMTTGQYGGIGSIIRKKGEQIVIAEPYEGSPSLKAGLMAGDIIMEVDGKSAEGKNTSELSKVLKGQPGTEVKLKIKRGEAEPKEIVVVREEIKVKDVPHFGMLDDKTGYIKLNGFTETASKEVKEAYEDLKENNDLQALVLDLRGNGGGLLREAVNIVNFFVDKGQEVVHTRGKIEAWDRSHKTLNTPLDKEIPLAVLIDGGSASASEIVSGALQDLDRAIVVGNKSFGKGLVQQTRDLSYNAKLKVTVAKYYIPSGRCIQKIDYSHRDSDGDANAIPDSLLKEFKTASGRTVLDGEGITPDVKVERKEGGDILYSLLRNNLIFDYATKYRAEKEEIVKAEEFRLNDTEYQAFIDFVNKDDFDYSLQSKDILKKLEARTKKEKYYASIESELEAIKEKLKPNKSEDMKKFEDEIKELLEQEIISRYYYQRGRVENSLARDSVVLKATDILASKDSYEKLLKP